MCTCVHTHKHTHIHTHKAIDFEKVDIKPSRVTCQAPQKSLESKDGKMAFEACYWLAFVKTI